MDVYLRNSLWNDLLATSHIIFQCLFNSRIQRRQFVGRQQFLHLFVGTTKTVLASVFLAFLRRVVIKQLGTVEGRAEVPHGMVSPEMVSSRGNLRTAVQ